MQQASGSGDSTWFRRHPLLALVAVNLGIFLFVAGVAEIAMRILVPYNPGFYSAVSGTDREFVHPYGVIKINSHGSPDEEFDLSHPHKVGYFGDSVTYGVGAGWPYRISDILEGVYTGYEHMNIGGIGLSISAAEIEWASDLAAEYGMEKAIYLFNMNDILPTDSAAGEQTTWIVWLRSTILDPIDWLRGRSYLYTALRYQVKQALQRQGYGFHGYFAYELFPNEQAQVIRETAERINDFHRSLAKRGIELMVVILPYEMQISREAEEEYASKGVRWSPGFIQRGTQRAVEEALVPEIRVFDAYYAFVDPADPSASREGNGLGKYFVYDKGDKLDWNHPNRAGHRAIAQYLVREGLLEDTPSLPSQERSASPAAAR